MVTQSARSREEAEEEEEKEQEEKQEEKQEEEQGIWGGRICIEWRTVCNSMWSNKQLESGTIFEYLAHPFNEARLPAIIITIVESSTRQQLSSCPPSFLFPSSLARFLFGYMRLLSCPALVRTNVRSFYCQKLSATDNSLRH